MNHVKHVIPMSDTSVGIKPEDIQPTVLPDVAEVRLQIFRRDEVKLIGGTGAQLCNKGGSVLFHVVQKLLIDV